MKIDCNIKKSPQFLQQYGILTLGTEKANPGKLGGVRLVRQTKFGETGETSPPIGGVAKLWALKGRQAAEVKQNCFIR